MTTPIELPDDSPAPPWVGTNEALSMDITPTRRASDYTFDIRINGLWVASAKTYGAADDVACLIWQATSARIINAVISRLNSPHPCPSCGDLTVFYLCPACEEWVGAVV